MSEGYPIVESRLLAPVPKQGAFGLGRRYRDGGDVPKIDAHHRVVYRVNDTYVVDRGLRLSDEPVVNATHVSVVDMRRSARVAVQLPLPSRDASHFTMQVTFLCTVTDPVIVVREGIDAAPILEEYLKSHRPTSELGLNFGLEDINHLRHNAYTEVKAYVTIRPPDIPGLEVSIASIEVLTPTLIKLKEDSQAQQQAGLLFSVYIPSGRLYAAEAGRLLSLFCDWLVATRGHGVRQAERHSKLGKVYEFFVEATVVQANLQEEFDTFSDFLTLCAEDPSAAVELLAPSGLGRDTSTDIVSRFGKETRRLQIDLRQERERRMLAIRHDLEEQLLEGGVDLRSVPRSQLNAMIEHLVPGPSAPASLTLLAAPWTTQPTAPVIVNINPQIISAMESTIIQNIQGTVHLGPQAQELLTLIDRFGGQEAATLQSAVHEFEDVNAPPVVRSVAKRRLKDFLYQVAAVARDVTVDLLEKYLESKGL